ncbi:MAG: J domain-containing protein [Saprospiraceae bacterium]|nr:J domain-containing protein [Saprospiraceae bacterium]
MSRKVEKSSVIVEKEKRLKALETRKKSLLTNLKKNTTTLDKLKVDIVEMQQGIRGRLIALAQKLRNLKQEIKEITATLKKSKKISKEEKKEITNLLKVVNQEFENMESGFGIPNMELNEEEIRKAGFNTDNFDRQRAFDFFTQFEEEIAEPDQKDIRKAYVKLAARFHPDKAKSNQEQEQFHLLMQQINAAYERGDLATLLELQSAYSEVKTLLEMGIQQEGAIADFLDAEIQRLEREVELLNSQLNRVKAELRNVKKSDIGNMYGQEMKAQQRGVGTQDWLKDVEDALENFKKLRDGILEYGNTGIIPDFLNEMVATDESLIEITEDMVIDDIISMFFNESQFDDDDDEFKPRAKKSSKKR